MPLPTVAATAVPAMAPRHVEDNGHGDGKAGGDGARGNNRGDDVWCVGPAIDELGNEHGR